MAYTTIDDPSEYFQTQLYTGTGSNGHAITNGGNSDLQPDMVWVKSRNDANHDHHLWDSNRGVGGKDLYPNETLGEGSDADRFTAFNTDGFSIGGAGHINTEDDTYVAWQWKANGGTTSSLSGGDITTTVQASTKAGFSIITYSGASNAADDNSNNSGAFWRLEHGLGAVPHWIWSKKRATGGWYMWHHGFTGASSTDGDHVNSNEASGQASEGGNRLWGNTAFSSTEYEIGGWDVINRNGATYVAYCFTEIQGYSKFGKYRGNGNVDGTFVYTGFKPAWVMQKQVNADGEFWMMKDNKREPFNQADANIYLNVSNAEGDTNGIDLLSNGFKCRTAGEGSNNTGNTYIYMAFAESPFVSSEGVPTTAR